MQIENCATTSCALKYHVASFQVLQVNLYRKRYRLLPTDTASFLSVYLCEISNPPFTV